MSDALLILNAGSSSLKFAIYEAGRPGADPALLLRGQIEGLGRQPRFSLADEAPASLAPAPGDAAVGKIADHAGALDLLLDWLATAGESLRLAAAGHRVVHGGTRRAAPARVTAALIEELAALGPLAPHHQPHNVAAIRALADRLPALPQVACFDTAFHATQPAVARRFALPRELWKRGLVRYGFHGLSYEYVVGALATQAGALPARLLVAHLGNGASLCAVKDGSSLATTMGFSTLDGLVMGTRSGALDPGVLLYLLREEGLDETALTDLLYNRSGLLGVSGESADMRTLLASASTTAAEAVELFYYRILREAGSLVTALEGLDALVFTGGIGEHAAPVRAAVCRGLSWLGVGLDSAANDRHGPRISRPDTRVAAWVLPANEELVIARHTMASLG